MLIQMVRIPCSCFTLVVYGAGQLYELLPATDGAEPMFLTCENVRLHLVYFAREKKPNPAFLEFPRERSEIQIELQPS